MDMVAATLVELKCLVLPTSEEYVLWSKREVAMNRIDSETKNGDSTGRNNSSTGGSRCGQWDNENFGTQ